MCIRDSYYFKELQRSRGVGLCSDTKLRTEHLDLFLYFTQNALYAMNVKRSALNAFPALKRYINSRFTYAPFTRVGWHL